MRPQTSDDNARNYVWLPMDVGYSGDRPPIAVLQSVFRRRFMTTAESQARMHPATTVARRIEPIQGRFQCRIPAPRLLTIVADTVFGSGSATGLSRAVS